ncbi:MAG: TolC family protein [Gemmatimonadaceae bacterium]|nr:TolC family protein [Gemmatimonadaceae bacterium]
MSVASAVLAAASLGAQPSARPTAPIVADSGTPLAFDAFYARVQRFHPVVQQARLLAAQADAELRVAYGSFDPQLSVFWDKKSFNGIGYYDETEFKATVPTPFGMDVKLGYDRAAGQIINPERATPSTGLYQLGVAIPIGQRIVTDERRNAVRQAKALKDVADGDRRGVVNRLLLDATKDFGRWYEAARRRAIAREGVQLASFRLSAVRERVRQGDAPAIDTIEASLEVQRREVTRLDTEQAEYVARLAVSAYLWDDRGDPVDPSPDAVPSLLGLDLAARVDSTALPRWLAMAEERHPELVKINGRVRQAEAQRLFVGQQLLPAASVEVSTLTSGDRRNRIIAFDNSSENYKTTALFKSSLLLLKERGRFDQAGQRLASQKFEAARLRREIALDVRSATNALSALVEQLRGQAIAVEQSRLLLAGELRRFENGESSLLIVNLRERALLDERVRLAGLEAKYAAARTELAVAVGEPSLLAVVR